MNYMKWAVMALVGLFAFESISLGAEGERFWHIVNRLQFEYDDNVNQADTDEQDSFKVVETVELQGSVNLENTFLSLRYSPSFIYWEDRGSDDTDLHHTFNVNLSHRLSPRVSLNASDIFRLQERPELIERGVLVREENDYIHNDVRASGEVKLSPETRIEGAGRYLLLRYDESGLSGREDFDLYVIGATLFHQMVPGTTLNGSFRYEVVEYDTAVNRDSDSIHVGGGVEQTFSPNLLGEASAGFQYKEFDNAVDDDDSSPFAQGSLTFLPTPATRMSAGAGYSLFEANVFPYVNQERLRVFGNIAHDLTARISLFLAAVFTHGEYDAGEASADAPTATDGEEDIFLFSARATYKVNRSNWLEAGWQFTSFDTDLRAEYDRNRLTMGWKIAL